MSYPGAICPRSGIIGVMSRTAVLATILLTALGAAVGCTKSAANQESPIPNEERKLAVPGPEGAIKGGPDAEAMKAATAARNRLAPDEGQIAIEGPGDAKAGGESTVKITVTPGSAYKVNTEFPTKLTLETTTGVTIAKAELTAGGHAKSKGDADVFDEKQLVFAVKLTPTATGNYTINGSFKFAVCDKAGSTCLAKKEPIAIQVAAK